MTSTATKPATRIDRLDEGAWLNRLLADVHEEIVGQPSAVAVQRIRARLLAQLNQPTRAAA